MAELDAETVDRAVRWCAQAGRTATADEVRRALAPLSWDQLLAVKALLADPPPERPLGPHALADIARGAPTDVAAEREREGRYRAEDDRAGTPEGPSPRGRSAPPGGRRRAPVIRRARDRSQASASVPPSALPDFAALRLPEGRAVLERLLRRLGARRRAIAMELAARWALPDGTRPGEADLASLLSHHGLLRAFERRERDEILHALRAAGGVRGVAAARLSLDVPELDAAVDRLGARPEAERIREERRSELRGRATLAERVRLLLVDEGRLADLGLLEEFERDLAARLPEHVRALRTGPEPLASALQRSLGLSRADVDALATRFSLDLRGRPAPPGPPRPRRVSAGAPARRKAPAAAGRGTAPPRGRGPGGRSRGGPKRPRRGG